MELAATLDPSFSFWYSTNKNSVRNLLPSGFEPYCEGDKAFWNIVLARMIRMRPAGLPVWCGIDCWQISYSLFVSAKGEAAGNIHGLFIIGSQVDPSHVSRLNHVLPAHRFQPAKIKVEIQRINLNLEILNHLGSNSLQIDFKSSGVEFRPYGNFLKPQHFFLSSNGEFLEIGENRFDEKEKAIVGVTGRWKFLSDLQQISPQFEFGTKSKATHFHVVVGHREHFAVPEPALVTAEFASGS